MNVPDLGFLMSPWSQSCSSSAVEPLSKHMSIAGYVNLQGLLSD